MSVAFCVQCIRQPLIGRTAEVRRGCFVGRQRVRSTVPRPRSAQAVRRDCYAALPTLTSARQSIYGFTREVSISLQSPYAMTAVAIAAVMSFVLAWVLARAQSMAMVRRLQLAATDSHMSSPMAALPFEGAEEAEETADNALWLNLSLFPSVWRLFRKNTATLIENTLQPILDKTELPSFLRKVKIRSLTVGTRPPLVRKIQRLPSRARSELQYSFVGRLVGDMKIELDVQIKIPLFEDRYITCPVTLTNLDIDSNVWIGFTLMPGPPWLRRIQWSLLKLPTVKLQLKVGNIVPLTAIPVLSSVLSHIFQKAIPQEFLFPKTEIIDMEPETVSHPPMSSIIDLADAVTVTETGEVSNDAASNDVLRTQYPALWALFDSMDDDDDGYLGPEEVVLGLSRDWGFSSTLESDRRALFNLLDDDDDGKVSFKEFIVQWPDLRSVFVPRRFKGVIAGVLQKARSLPRPRWGYSNPYVVFLVETKSVASRKNFDTSKRGKQPGEAVWNEGFELEVENPDAATLTVQVREGSWCAFYRNLPAIAPGPSEETETGLASDRVEYPGRVLGTGRIKVNKMQTGKQMKLWVPLDSGEGRVLIDVAYSHYVDPRSL